MLQRRAMEEVKADETYYFGDAIMVKPCEKCDHNRWRTVKKNLKWKCRKCNNERSLNDDTQIGNQKA